jgi:integrase
MFLHASCTPTKPTGAKRSGPRFHPEWPPPCAPLSSRSASPCARPRCTASRLRSGICRLHRPARYKRHLRGVPCPSSHRWPATTRTRSPAWRWRVPRSHSSAHGPAPGSDGQRRRPRSARPTGRRIAGRRVDRAVSPVAAKAGIGHVTPHQLRHTLAAQAINREHTRAWLHIQSAKHTSDDFGR